MPHDQQQLKHPQTVQATSCLGYNIIDDAKIHSVCPFFADKKHQLYKIIMYIHFRYAVETKNDKHVHTLKFW